jgi:hypothetical protein
MKDTKDIVIPTIIGEEDPDHIVNKKDDKTSGKLGASK